ncbi:MAG: hypothetical protein GY737_31025 [Desulfobacteraceae bacterium]|nr:hypothetical protein [Desulfobacteraceae bacterium]
MKKDRLFDYLETQENSKLLELLSSAFDHMDTHQRNDVFGEIIQEIPPSSVDGEELLGDIEAFHLSSLAGYYYEPFHINSKNFSDIPEETEKWFDEIGDHLEDSSRLTDQGDHAIAVQCFQLLNELIDKMEDGEEIVFADEYGTWMITGDEKRFVTSYLISLSAISTPEEYAEGSIPLIKRDSYESFHNKVYSIALKRATKEQKAYLQKEVKKQKVRTSYNKNRF